MCIAIALVFQDRYDEQGLFEERLVMIKRIVAKSGGWGLPGIEVSANTVSQEVESRLKQAIEGEMQGLIIPETPKLMAEIDHEGRRILIYQARFAGRPQRDFHNPAESAVFADLSPYRLTDLAKKVIKKLPRLPKIGQKQKINSARISRVHAY